ncbi:hypothetical protein BS636_09130 [Acinetobacter sp. LoGeW2-3]|uniref:ABZJ_00895 family protein n=1 Tax=Acinetobacter sp. LoGeW2-3 TaxID=1808001 RepID=UPI000C05C6D4|nr:ABZJ_00895 family protein [Acinetobacter sp. LoGeW2-3]ATO19803.1 hypothetical protein BS636_09130 [Acinetobacter sp. LoGeW2-3]
MMIKKYLGYFTMVYLVAILIVAGLSIFIDLPGSSIAIPALFGAGTAAAIKFVQDQQRLPTATEKKQLVWGCIGISVLISLILSLSILGISEEREIILDMLESLPVGIWVIVLLLGLAIQYVVLALCFGWMSKSALKGPEAKKQAK